MDQVGVERQETNSLEEELRHQEYLTVSIAIKGMFEFGEGVQ